MNEKTQLSRRIKFYIVGSNVLGGTLALLLAVTFFQSVLWYWLWPLGILTLVFALVLFVNALIIFSRVGRLYPSLKGSTIFGGWAAAMYPVICVFVGFSPALSLKFSNEIYLVFVLLLNPITYALALLAIHAVIIRRANKVIKADLAQVAP